MTEVSGAARDDGWDCHVHVFDASAPVRAGHYQPADHPLERIEDTAHPHGVRHLVLVQPSVYGSDNAVLLRALAIQPGRHRGVVVLADDVSDETLEAMQAAGVCGARLNRVSPVGDDADLSVRVEALAPRLARLGWHLQWYVRAADLPQVATLHRSIGVTCVLDHLAGLSLQVSDDDPAWRAVERLADDGAWLKLSGWYRLDAAAPYDLLVPRIRRLAALFGERLVWGSDWPHTAFSPPALPEYRSLWQPVVEALGPDAAADLRCRPPAIYR